MSGEHQILAQTDQQNENQQAKKPARVRVIVHAEIDFFADEIRQHDRSKHVQRDRLCQYDEKCRKSPGADAAQSEHRPPALHVRANTMPRKPLRICVIARPRMIDSSTDR